MDVSQLPLNVHLGLENLRSGSGDSEIVLNPSGVHLNHLQTVHATVLYAMAEAASGQLIVDKIVQQLPKLTVVLRGAAMKYRRPGHADHSLKATARFDATETADSQLVRLSKRGRALVAVSATVQQAETELATGTFNWFVALNDS